MKVSKNQNHEKLVRRSLFQSFRWHDCNLCEKVLLRASPIDFLSILYTIEFVWLQRRPQSLVLTVPVPVPSSFWLQRFHLGLWFGQFQFQTVQLTVTQFGSERSVTGMNFLKQPVV